MKLVGRDHQGASHQESLLPNRRRQANEPSGAMMKSTRGHGCLGTVLSAALLILASAPASAALTVKNWVGAGSGGSGTDFNTPANWNPATAPTSADSCVMAISANANATITLSSDITIGALK